jgi:hypothetical protein
MENPLKDRYRSLPSDRRIPFKQLLKENLRWTTSVFFKKINGERKLKPSERVIFDTLIQNEEISLLRKLNKQYPNVLKGDDI